MILLNFLCYCSFHSFYRVILPVKFLRDTCIGRAVASGYDGDSSDSDDEVAISLSDSMVARPTLPPFWLIMKINNECVNVYFHAR
jgi:hypothetical protein